MESILGGCLAFIIYKVLLLLVVKESVTCGKICTVSSHTLRGPACLLSACCQKCWLVSEQKLIKNKTKVSVAAFSSIFTHQGKLCHFHFYRHFSSLSNIVVCLEDASPPLVMTNISHLLCSVDYLAILNFFLTH